MACGCRRPFPSVEKFISDLKEMGDGRALLNYSRIDLNYSKEGAQRIRDAYPIELVAKAAIDNLRENPCKEDADDILLAIRELGEISKGLFTESELEYIEKTANEPVSE